MMRRVLIVGCSGAGKSTLARRLGALLDLPVVHLDHLYWRPGWIAASDDEFHAAQQETVAGDRWIIDGNYSSSLHLRLPRADTVIFLDLPRRASFRRIFVRTFRERGRDTQAPGCVSKVDREFIAWVWTWQRLHRGPLLDRLAREAPHARIVRLTSPRQVRAFLRAVTQTSRT
jgi:adenylate kinase family enzyme